MRVGAFLAPWGPLTTPKLVERFASAVEDAGFASLWTGDHVIFPRGSESLYRYSDEEGSPFGPGQPHLEPVTLLSYLAARTSTVDLGISVFVLPMRNPVVSAKMLGNLQTLSRGRLILGVGVGWMKEEFEVLDADFARRGSTTDEYIQILRHLWAAEPEPFKGEHYRFGSVGFAPAPEPIPVVVGGNSRQALRRAARLGDGWHPLRMEPAEVAERLTALATFAEDEGRAPSELTIVLRARLLDLDQTRAGPIASGSDPEGFRDRLGAYADAGVDEFVLEFPYPGSPADAQLEWLAWFGEHGLAGELLAAGAVT